MSSLRHHCLGPAGAQRGWGVVPVPTGLALHTGSRRPQLTPGRHIRGTVQTQHQAVHCSEDFLIKTDEKSLAAQRKWSTGRTTSWGQTVTQEQRQRHWSQSSLPIFLFCLFVLFCVCVVFCWFCLFLHRSFSQWLWFLATVHKHTPSNGSLSLTGTIYTSLLAFFLKEVTTSKIRCTSFCTYTVICHWKPTVDIMHWERCCNNWRYRLLSLAWPCIDVRNHQKLDTKAVKRYRSSRDVGSCGLKNNDASPYSFLVDPNFSWPPKRSYSFWHLWWHHHSSSVPWCPLQFL